jgi:molybdenum cofactor guanylyltransferase
VHRSGDSAVWLDAVVLAGGRAARLGGADKPALLVGECSLVTSVVAAAAAAGARRVVVVGPDRPGLELAASELRVVREDPPASGPVPALSRGLAEVTAPWVFVLAADLPFLRAADLGSLLAAARGVGLSGATGSSGAAGSSGEAGSADRGGWSGAAAGAVLADDTGRPQWLAGCWQAGVLRSVLAGYRGDSLHGLLHPLSPVILAPATDQAGPPPWLDCDTEDDVRLARAWSGVPAGNGPDAAR